MSAPRILVSTRRELRRGKAIQFVGRAHLDLLVGAGAMPIPVPALPGAERHLDALVDAADGLLLVEGGDVSPAYRGEPVVRPEDLEELDPGKDAVDLGLVERARAAGLPMLGVCRGSEIIALLYGSRLYEDVGRELGGALIHLSHDDYDGYRHRVDLVEQEPLTALYGDRALLATSCHHQGVKLLGHGLRPMAVAPDGLVEAFRDPAAPFVWGLQFHPERQLREHAGHRAVHAAFVDAARRHASTRRRERWRGAPRVLVPMRPDVRKGRPIQFVHESHLEELLAAGVLPQPVPAIEALAVAAGELAEAADGLLLVEGGDIAPERHDVRPDRLGSLREVDPDRDAVEFALTAAALDRGLPVLATCRGAQVLNVLAGGTLHAHLPDDVGTGVLHIDVARYDDHRHPITLAEEGPMAEIYGEFTVTVTSVHHQGIELLAPRFRPLGWSPDGLVEAFDDPAHGFLLAVQHHPERQLDEHPGHRVLYRRLADAALAWRGA